MMLSVYAGPGSRGGACLAGEFEAEYHSSEAAVPRRPLRRPRPQAGTTWRPAPRPPVEWSILEGAPGTGAG
jgi:hypothetical protein